MTIDILGWSTMILAVWGALGPLAGVFCGQHLAKRWQKEQWVRENRKQECRELLDAIYEQGVARKGSHEDDVTQFKLTRTFISRIFIADELERLKTQERWKDLFVLPKQNLSSEEYLKKREELTDEIRKLARE